jgi:hypothetical protein
VPAASYYLIVGSALAGGAGALAGRRRPALFFAALWAVLTARFCLTRLRGTSRAPRHLAEMIVTSALIPPLALFWRLRGALRFRVLFL